MERFERETRVAAPFERVWAFHSTIDGLRRVTPGWLDLRVEEVRLPAAADVDRGGGDRDGAAADVDRGGDDRDGADATVDGTLVAGALVTLSVRPFGVGPRRRFVSAITAREEGEASAFFRDEMRQGPLREWRHTHRFDAVDGGTLLRDRVEFETPFGQAVDAAAKLGVAAFFAYRHRRTKRLLE